MYGVYEINNGVKTLIAKTETRANAYLIEKLLAENICGCYEIIRV